MTLDLIVVLLLVLRLLLSNQLTDKWQPPFRPSQVLYSEFPEDRGRSLNLIDRRDVLKKKSYPTHPYEPPPNNRLPDESPQDYSRDYADPDYNSNGSEEPSKEYSSYDGPSKDYSDHKDYSDYKEPNYIEEPAQSSVDYSSESSVEYYKKYDEYGDYREAQSSDEKDGRDDDYTPEDVDPDAALLNPSPPDYTSDNSSHQQPPLRASSQQEPISSTEHPTTQLELPGTSPSVFKLPTPLPIQSTGYSLNRTPAPEFRKAALALVPPSQPGWSHWKNVLAQAELSNLQVMKPPPLGQAQTWSRVMGNNFLSSSGINGQLYARGRRFAARDLSRFP